jgi:hypothetical protein
MDSQGRKTKFAFPLYTVETGTKFRLRFHCIQGKRKFRFSSLWILHKILALKNPENFSANPEPGDLVSNLRVGNPGYGLCLL